MEYHGTIWGQKSHDTSWNIYAASSSQFTLSPPCEPGLCDWPSKSRDCEKIRTDVDIVFKSMEMLLIRYFIVDLTTFFCVNWSLQHWSQSRITVFSSLEGRGDVSLAMAPVPSTCRIAMMFTMPVHQLLYVLQCAPAATRDVCKTIIDEIPLLACKAKSLHCWLSCASNTWGRAHFLISSLRSRLVLLLAYYILEYQPPGLLGLSMERMIWVSVQIIDKGDSRTQTRRRCWDFDCQLAKWNVS